MMNTVALSTTGGGNLILTEAKPLDQNPAAVYLAGLGKGSRGTMRQSLDLIAALVSGSQVDALGLNWAALRFQHTQAIRAKLAESYSAATVNKMLSGLRGTLKAAWRLGQMDGEIYRRAVDLEAVKGETLPAGRNVTAGEISALFAACAADPTPAGQRDAAILALLRLGLRRAEVAGLELSDLNQEGEAVEIRGKGDKQRLVPLTGGAAKAVADWLSMRGDDAGPLLLRVNKGGRISCKGITAQAVYDVLSKRASQAGVSNVTPHDWRRTFAGDLLDIGADLVVIQKLMGHASRVTTSRYDRRPEAAKREAIERLHIP